MTRFAARPLLTFAGLALVIAGCAKTPPAWQQADATAIRLADQRVGDELAAAAEPGRARTWKGHVTAVASRRPPIPHGGLSLPCVSPDGQWIAFLDQPADSAAPATHENLVTGRGLADVSLWVRRLDSDGLAHPVALGGASWPTWSDDGRTLVFVSYDEQLGCSLGLHDAPSKQTRRVAAGLRHMLMPRLSPDGSTVAVAAYGQIADEAIIFLIDLATGAATPAPATGNGAQLFPIWLNAQTLAFVQLDDDGGRLIGWQVNSPDTYELAKLNAPPSIFDAQHLFAGVLEPISPDLLGFAYYDPAADALQLVPLGASGAADTSEASGARPLEGVRSGAWWATPWFIAADTEGTRLVAFTPAPGTPGNSNHPEDAQASAIADHTNRAARNDDDLSQPDHTLRLLPGRWALLWADPAESSILLAGPADQPGKLQLLQLWLVAGSL